MTGKKKSTHKRRRMRIFTSCHKPSPSACCLILTLLHFFALKNSTAVCLCDQGEKGSESFGRRTYRKLIRQLTESSDPLVPPNADNLSEPVQVSINTMVDYVDSLDTSKQLLKIFLEMDVSWRDGSLSWNTTEFPVQEVSLNNDAIWRPTIVPVGAEGSSDQLMLPGLNVKVRHDGLVTWWIAEKMSWSCPQFVQMFPFDQQVCVMMFPLHSVSVEAVDITLATVQKAIIQNPEWVIVDVNIKRMKGYETEYPIIKMVLRRRWMFYVLNILLPVVLVSSMNCVVFVLPVHSADKMPVSVTTFLTLSIFMTVVDDTLPNNSLSVCYLAVYLAAQITLGVLGVFLTAIIIACCHDDQQSFSSPDPEGLTMDLRSSESSSGDADDPSGKREEKLADLTKVTRRKVHWPSVGYKINAICLPLFIAFTVISLAVFMLAVTLTDHPQHDY